MYFANVLLSNDHFSPWITNLIMILNDINCLTILYQFQWSDKRHVSLVISDKEITEVPYDNYIVFFNNNATWAGWLCTFWHSFGARGFHGNGWPIRCGPLLILVPSHAPHQLTFSHPSHHSIIHWNSIITTS